MESVHRITSVPIGIPLTLISPNVVAVGPATALTKPTTASTYYRVLPILSAGHIIGWAQKSACIAMLACELAAVLLVQDCTINVGLTWAARRRHLVTRHADVFLCPPAHQRGLVLHVAVPTGSPR